MKTKALKASLLMLIVLVMMIVSACGNGTKQTPSESSPEASGQSLTKVKIALSAFQDVNSIHVGVAQGFFKEEGIELSIQNTDWPGANELLIGGHVDMATSSDSDVALQNANGQTTTLAFPLFYFAGGGLMYDPKKYNWKTYNELFKDDVKAAMKATLEQAKGKKVGVSSGGGEYATFIEMISYSGLDIKDFKVVNLAQEELPPALISGSIDIMISGIPQRLAVLKEGYATLIDQTTLPSTVAHAGFAAKREWIDANPEIAAKVEKGILKSLAFIEQNPDKAFPIISAKLKEAGTVVSTEDLKGVWNKMEFFPSSKEWYTKEVATVGGKFYWKDRFETVVKNLKVEDKLKDNVKLEQLNYGLKVIESIK
jgi:NitT/TauT family transport system substrate-binding protein